MVRRLYDGDAAEMECEFCGERRPLDDGLPYVNQTASFATDHGCPEVRRVKGVDAH